jgi:hypothetical protein
LLGRALAAKQTLQIADIRDERPSDQSASGTTGAQIAQLAGARTVVAVPMLKDNELVGAIVVYGQEVRPFTDRQIALLTNFANQAVIAIENTRLLNELRESLEQQTATSEVLRVISSSPGELEPVFELMLKNAARLCEAKFGALYLHEGGALRIVATHNVPPAFAETRMRGPFRPAPGGALGEMVRTKQTVHLADLAATQAYLERNPTVVQAVELAHTRTVVAVPMLKAILPRIGRSRRVLAKTSAFQLLSIDRWPGGCSDTSRPHSRTLITCSRMHVTVATLCL